MSKYLCQECHYLYDRFNIFAFYTFKKLLYILWRGIFRNMNGKSHNGYQPLQCIEFFFIRMVMDSVY